MASVKGLAHEVSDVGSHTPDPVGLPGIAWAVCEAIHAGEADRGPMVCGTGVGASIAADKVTKARLPRSDPARRAAHGSEGPKPPGRSRNPTLATLPHVPLPFSP